MVFESFNDAGKWTETDPDNNLTQPAHKSQWTSLERQDGDCQLLGDNGVGSIPALFDYFFELEIEALEAGDLDNRQIVFPIVFNNSSGLAPGTTPYIFLILIQNSNDDTTFDALLGIDNGVPDTDTSVALSVGTVYFCELERTNTGEDVDLYIRTGSHAGVLVDTLSVADANMNNPSRNTGTFVEAKVFSI